MVVGADVVASVPSVDFSVVPFVSLTSEPVVVSPSVDVVSELVVAMPVVACVPSVDFRVVPLTSEPVVVSPSVFEVGADVVYCESVTIIIIELINQELIMHDMYTVLLMSTQ